MSSPEDARTLWIGNLHEQVTDVLVYELFLQTGPIDRLVFPTEGEGEEKKNKGHAYVVFQHPESVQYASQVLDGSTLFNEELQLKARGLPISYQKERGSVVPSHITGNNKGRFDNNSLRGGFNRGSTFPTDFSPRGRGGYNNRGRGGFQNNYNQGGFNNNFNFNNNQTGWVNQTNMNMNNYNQQGMDDKRSRIMQQQNVVINAHQQQQMYNPQQQQQQQQQYQQQWAAYNSWSMGNMGGYQQQQQQGYTQDQYGNYYQQQ